METRSYGEVLLSQMNTTRKGGL